MINTHHRADQNDQNRSDALTVLFLRPQPIVDEEEDFMAEVYNMPLLPYEGLYLGFPTLFTPLGAIPPPTTNFTRESPNQPCSV